jgi:hypothetical protein
LAQNEEVFGLNEMSWFPANLHFPATPKKHESELATFDQPTKLKHSSVINVRVSRFLWNRKSLSVERGGFVVLEKLERNLLGNGFIGDQKSSWKFFDGNSWKFIESTHLCWNCLMFLWSSCRGEWENSWSIFSWLSILTKNVT